MSRGCRGIIRLNCTKEVSSTYVTSLTYLLLTNCTEVLAGMLACVFSPRAELAVRRARMLDTPGRGYRALGPAEGIAPSRRTGGTCGLVQCASLSLLHQLRVTILTR